MAADAVGSRTVANKAVGLDLLRQAGVVITSTEAAAFQWCGAAGTERFKALSRLVK